MRETITNLQAVAKLVAGTCLLAGLCYASSAAQAYTPPPPPLTTAPCVPTKKDPCDQPGRKARTPPATDANPFPGEPSAPGTSPSSSAAPSSSAVPSATEANPFPGEPPESPRSSSEPGAPGSGKGLPPAADGSSSSSSSSSDGADEPALKDEGSEGSTRFERKRLPKVGMAPEDREAEDLDVSRFYSDKGDFNAAYLRAKDAVSVLPSDPEAHWLLADSARRLRKLDEARTEYQAYLQLAPDGDHHAAAQKELTGLKPK